MPQHEGRCRTPRKAGLNFTVALFDIANKPLTRLSAIKALLPLAVSQEQAGRIRICSEHPGRMLFESEVFPMRNMVIACLDKIAAGERQPVELHKSFDHWMAKRDPEGPKQITTLSVYHGCGHRSTQTTIGLPMLAFDELVQLAQSDFIVARCALSSHSCPRHRRECRHFFSPSPGTKCCHRSCSLRLEHLSRTCHGSQIQTESSPKRYKRDITV